MTTLRIKPKCKAVPVRRPDGQYLAMRGETVVRTGYWLRRLQDGDVILMTPKKNTATTTLTPKGDRDVHSE